MLIDTHAHLDFPEFSTLPGTLEAVLERAAQAGVTRVITIGTSLESSRQAIGIAERFPQVFATIGIHPGSAHETDPAELQALAELAKHPRVVAVGETGLDYYRLPGDGRDEEIKRAQAVFFRAQLEIAQAHGLNVVVHQRGDCLADTLALLAPLEGGENAGSRDKVPQLRAVFHCFGNDAQTAVRLVEKGHLVSFTGIVTFKNGLLMQSCAKGVPAGAYLVETDAPYLAPTPHRGSVCEPAHTRLTAEKIAALRGEPLEQVARETTAAAERFFQLERFK